MKMWILFCEFSPGCLCPNHEGIHWSLDVSLFLWCCWRLSCSSNKRPVITLKYFWDGIRNCWICFEMLHRSTWSWGRTCSDGERNRNRISNWSNHSCSSFPWSRWRRCWGVWTEGESSEVRVHFCHERREKWQKLWVKSVFFSVNGFD